MDLGDPFSKLKEKVRHRLTRRKHKPGGDVVGADWEIVDPDWIIDPASSLPQPETHVMACDGEGSGANVDGQQACSEDLPPQQDEPEPVQADGSENDQGEGGEDVNGKQVNQSYSHLHLDVGVVMGSGFGQGDDADEEERSGKPDGV